LRTADELSTRTSTLATATAAPPYGTSLPALGFINRVLFALAFNLVVRGEMDELIIRQFLPQLANSLA
jgi:hypothetical protein